MKLKYSSFGRGKDVIFLHGWGGSASAFLFVANRLKGVRCTLLDFFGFGDSDVPDSPRTVKDYANDVLSLMELLNIKSATLVCHSFGGRVGIELASHYPDRVEKLVLIDSAGLKPKRGIKYHLRVGAHKLLRAMGLNGLGGSSDYRALGGGMKRTFVNVVNYDQTKLLPKISCPTAIFWGKRDKETPIYMAKRLKSLIPDSEIFWLNGGHFAYAEDISTFFAILSAFIS